jgi:hypothetical protein
MGAHSFIMKNSPLYNPGLHIHKIYLLQTQEKDTQCDMRE